MHPSGICSLSLHTQNHCYSTYILHERGQLHNRTFFPSFGYLWWRSLATHPLSLHTKNHCLMCYIFRDVLATCNFSRHFDHFFCPYLTNKLTDLLNFWRSRLVGKFYYTLKKIRLRGNRFISLFFSMLHG